MPLTSHAELQWLDFAADLLASRQVSLSEEAIARLLASTLDSGACAFSSAGTGPAVRRIWPSDLFRDASYRVPSAVTDVPPVAHPILRYCLERGTSQAMQLADVPHEYGDRWRASGLDSICRAVEVHHQIALPLQIRPGAHRVFVTGRGSAYSENEVHLACSVQRLLIGIDRQVRTLARWEATASPELVRTADALLTPREVAVLALTADGLTAAAAARRLVISERTVHKHLQRIYHKLGVSDRVSAVRAAHRLGLVDQ